MKLLVIPMLFLSVLLTTGCTAGSANRTNQELEHLRSGVSGLVQTTQALADIFQENDRVQQLAEMFSDLGHKVDESITLSQNAITAQGTYDPQKTAEAAQGIANMIDPRLGTLAGAAGSAFAIWMNRRRQESELALTETVRGIQKFKENGASEKDLASLKNHLSTAQSDKTKKKVASKIISP